MMKNKGFTLMEVLIACAVLSLFFIGLLSLYSSGSKMGNATMWLQSTINQLKTAARQINTSIRKSSYPTIIKFPQEIIERTEDCFKLQYYTKNNGVLYANGTTNETFLITTEATPAKTGFSDKDVPAYLTYHIFRLENNNDLSYYKCQSKIEASMIEKGFTVKFDSIPPQDGSTNPTIVKTVLVRNVESVECHKKRKVNEGEPTNDKAQPIEIKITCFMPNSKGTRRSETTVGTPNVDLKSL